MSTSSGEQVDATPTKSFFVSMLTRDIKLEDAILDLLDNCVDGIIRSGSRKGPKPYDSYEAEIRFDAESFSISDNCGGIPWSMHDYAFRMGRPSGAAQNAPGSMGVYGIGMKRAMFKMGGRCSISTRSGNDQYKIEITPEWLANEKTWNIGVSRKPNSGGAGTSIKVSELHRGIAKIFGDARESFGSTLVKTIATHYAYIIDKGFKVTVNGKVVKPMTINILCNELEQGGGTIKPFVYTDKIDGVEVYLAVGLNNSVPSDARLDRELESPTPSSENAGWTVLCNGRAVLYCDRTELTGWGDGAPKYHTQFIAISGVVEFWSEDSSKLPTTTTKRGLNASSTLYREVRNKMLEGMKIFTKHTAEWKGRADEWAGHIDERTYRPLSHLKELISSMQLSEVPGMQNARQYTPCLPTPPKPEESWRWIRFRKDPGDIRAVAEYLDDPDLDPSGVGSECFDIIHNETRQ